MTTAINALPLALSALTGLAACEFKNDKPDRAEELLNLVLRHPASNQETSRRAQRLLAELNLAVPTAGQEPSRAAISSLAHEANQQFDALVARLLPEI